jgi:hypothetical protein
MVLGSARAAPVTYDISFSGFQGFLGTGVARVTIDFPARTGSLSMPNLLYIAQAPTENIPLSLLSSDNQESLSFGISEQGFPTDPAFFPYTFYGVAFNLQSTGASLFTGSGDLRPDLVIGDFSVFSITANGQAVVGGRDYVVCPLPTVDNECPSYAFSGYLSPQAKAGASGMHLVPEPSAGAMQLPIVLGLTILGIWKLAPTSVYGDAGN